MARHTLSTWEKERKKVFEKELRDFSLTALENIKQIANKSLDQKVKLEANKFLLEKAIGKNYCLIDFIEQQEENRLNINLISIGSGNDKKSGANKEDVWDSEDDNWGTETYNH